MENRYKQMKYTKLSTLSSTVDKLHYRGKVNIIIYVEYGRSYLYKVILVNGRRD